MDALQQQVQSVIDGHIDFEGQKLADYLTTNLLIFFSVIAFLAGYWTQDITKTLYISLFGLGLTFIAVVPPWPIYNRNPIKFLPAMGIVGDGGVIIMPSGVSETKKGK